MSRLLGAGLLLLTLVAGTGGLTYAASGSSTPALAGSAPAARHAAVAPPGYQTGAAQRPSAALRARAAAAAPPGPNSCQLQGTVMPSANVGSNDNYLNEVTALAANNLWSVGTFYNGATATYQTLVEHWPAPDNSWSVVASPNVGAGNNELYAISSSSDNDVWAAGYYYMDGEPGHDATLIERWNGTAWAVVPSANVSADSNNDLYGISVVSKEDIWAVGGYYDDQSSATQTLIEHWDGSAWVVVPSPNIAGGDNSLYAVDAITATDVWAVGQFYNTTTYTYQPLIEHWNGTAWAIVSGLNLNANNRYFYKVTAIAANDVWAVGSTWDASNIDQTLIEHWNGTAWTIVASPNVGTEGNNLYSISAVSKGDIWAAGNYYDSSSDTYQTLVEHWNGTAWTVVASPNKGSAINDLYGIAAISPTNVWFVGGYTNLGKDASEGATQTLTTKYSALCPQPTGLATKKP